MSHDRKAFESIRGGESPEINGGQLRNIEYLKTLVGKKYKDFDEAGHYIGCFEPLYLLYDNLPKYPLLEGEEDSFSQGYNRILENFEKTESPKPLDLIVFRFRGDILHVGILLEARKFFHVQRGSTFEVRRLLLYENKILGYYRAKKHLTRK